jgi:hypothetical protein
MKDLSTNISEVVSSKREKKDKKRKREKKKESKKKHKHHKHDKKSKNEKIESDHSNSIAGDEDMKEIQEFKEVVQGKKTILPGNADIEKGLLLYSSALDIAAAFGISKGLLRTSESQSSFSQQYSKQLFGGDDDTNPATRQRLKREMTAQKALSKARHVVASRLANDSTQPSSSSIADISNRFCSGKTQR